MGIGLIPISAGMGALQPDLEDTLTTMVESVRGTTGRTQAPLYLCEAVHQMLQLPSNYTVLGAGVDLLRRLFYVGVESDEIPEHPEGTYAPYVRVVYQSSNWDAASGKYIPCPLRLCSIRVDEPESKDRLPMPIIVDGRTPETLAQAVKMHASDMSFRDILAMVAREHPEFFEQLSDNNNNVADYLRNLIDTYFEVRWRASNKH